MEMQNIVFGLVPAVALLTASFFVLLAAAKNDSPALKAFGIVIVALLWISAALVFAKGLTGNRFIMNKKFMSPDKGCSSMMKSGMKQMNNQMPAK